MQFTRGWRPKKKKKKLDQEEFHGRDTPAPRGKVGTRGKENGTPKRCWEKCLELRRQLHDDAPKSCGCSVITLEHTQKEGPPKAGKDSVRWGGQGNLKKKKVKKKKNHHLHVRGLKQTLPPTRKAVVERKALGGKILQQRKNLEKS